jgi:phosphatidylglycerophosphate synthase
VYKEERYSSVYDTIVRKFPGKEKKEHGFLQNVMLFYLKSLKPFYVEELLVFFLYRPLGFLIAFPLYRLPVSPDAITILRSMGGIIAGVFFAQGTYGFIATGAIALFLSNIFDCADGQLARMRESSSWIGTTLDAFGDFATTFSVYAGTAVCLSRTLPAVGGWWYLICGICAISLMIHINGFCIFRYEFIHYTIGKYPEDLKTMEEQKSEYEAAKASNMPLKQRIFLALQYVQVFPTDMLAKIVFPKGYGGYKRWFVAGGQSSTEPGKSFKAKYGRSNQRILQGFGAISTLSNLSMFVIAGLAGHLEWALYAIIFGFNAVFLAMVIIQRMSLKKQLAAAGIF